MRFSHHDHLLTIKSITGAEESFSIDAKTVADTETGVAEGFKFELVRGNAVRVLAATVNGGETALLIVPIM